MWDTILYILKTYGMKVAILICCVIVIIYGINKIFDYKLELGKLQKVADLKIAEEKRLAVKRRQDEIKEIVRVYHQMIDALLHNLMRYWTLERAKRNPDNLIFEFITNIQRTISFTRTNTQHLDSEFCAYMENGLGRVAGIINVDWRQVDQWKGCDDWTPCKPFSEEERLESHDILRDLMEKTNQLIERE